MEQKVRECVKQIIAQAESAGYRDLDVFQATGCFDFGKRTGSISG